MGKRCFSCKKRKPLKAFGKKKTAKDGLRSICKSCTRDRHRMRKYGLTPEEFEGFMIRQGRKCAICREKKPLRIDHDHSLGHVRGLLCQRCNILVGFLEVNEELVPRAVRYLEV